VEFWGRWTFASAAMMPAAFLAFAQVFPTREHAPPRRLTQTIQVVAAIFTVCSAATPWVAHSFVVTSGVLTRSPGPLLRGFSLFFLLSAAAMFASLTKKWRLARGLARAQLRLYSLGLLLFSAGAITTNLILPSIIGDSRYSPVGPCFVLAFLAFVAHG